MNLSVKQRQTHRQREQTYGCQDGGRKKEGGTDWESGVSRSQLLHIIYRVDKQQGPTGDRELHSISCKKPKWRTI